jgi:hypothetical protein
MYIYVYIHREWSEKLPVLASIPGFREDLTSAFIEPFVGNLDYSDDPDQAPGEVRADNHQDFISPRSVRAPTITQELSAKEARVKLMKESRGGFAKHQGRLNKEVEAAERRVTGWHEAAKLITLLRSLQSVVFVALPPSDLQLNHHLLLTKSVASNVSGDGSQLENVTSQIRDSLKMSTEEQSLKPGSEAEINIDAINGDALSHVKKRIGGNSSSNIDNFDENDRSLSRSTSRKSMFAFKSSSTNNNTAALLIAKTDSGSSIKGGMLMNGDRANTLSASPLKGSTGSAQSPPLAPLTLPTATAQSTTSANHRRKSVAENTAELLENFKMAIGITREEISRKLYFRIPQHGVEMGDSVLMLLTPDHHENGPDAHGYYLPFRAKQVVVSDTDGAPSILKAHHRHRRRAADAFFSLGVIYTGGKGVKVG